MEKYWIEVKPLEANKPLEEGKKIYSYAYTLPKANSLNEALGEYAEYQEKYGGDNEVKLYKTVDVLIAETV